MARERVSTTPGDTGRRPLLRFDVARKLLQDVGGTGAGSVAPGEAGLSVRLDMVLTAPEITALASDRAAAAMVGRVVEAAAKRLEERIRKVSRPTYKTGRFYSLWRVKVGSRGGLKSSIEAVNQTPYALYVHRKGTPKERTVVNTYVKPLVEQASQEVLEDLVAVMRRRAVAAALSGFARGAL